MRKELYFYSDPNHSGRYFENGSVHLVDFARIVELYRDVDLKNESRPWGLIDTLCFFDLADVGVHEEDVEHGDPAAIPAKEVDFYKMWLAMVNWAEANTPKSDWMWNTFHKINGTWGVLGTYVSDDDTTDDAVLIYGRSKIYVVTRGEVEHEVVEYKITNTAHRTVTYKGQTYTLAEDITYSMDTYYDDPIEPNAQVESEQSITIYWYFPNREEFEAWDTDHDLSEHIEGVLILDDD